MNFNELGWAATCFYYRAVGDKRYGNIMRDRDFLTRLRSSPREVSLIEFEDKAILGFINMENYDLLVAHRLAEKILATIVTLQPEISTLKEADLSECPLDGDTGEAILKIYSELRAYGLWITGASKICHLLNDRLFPLLSPDLVRYFNITDDKTSLHEWLKQVQADISEASVDFNRQGLTGAPADFLSHQLGYSTEGYDKSLVKFADEYYWLRYGDGLPVPPRWIPAPAHCSSTAR